MKNIPNKIKKIAKHFELLGSVKIKTKIGTSTYYLIITGKDINIDSLFILAKQYNIFEFIPFDSKQILICIPSQTKPDK